MTTINGLDIHFIHVRSKHANGDDLKRIDVPTLIIYGDDDQVVPFNDAFARS